MRIAINVFEVSIRLLRLSLCFCTGSCLRCTEKFSAGVVVVSQVYPQMKILPESISEQKFEYFDAYQWIKKYGGQQIWKDKGTCLWANEKLGFKTYSVEISPLFFQPIHTNYYKIVNHLKSFKIIIVAPTCFGLHKPSSGICSHSTDNFK